MLCCSSGNPKVKQPGVGKASTPLKLLQYDTSNCMFKATVKQEKDNQLIVITPTEKKIEVTLQSKVRVTADSTLLQFELPAECVGHGVPLGGALMFDINFGSKNYERYYTLLNEDPLQTSTIDIVVKRYGHMIKNPDSGICSRTLCDADLGTKYLVHSPISRCLFTPEGNLWYYDKVAEASRILTLKWYATSDIRLFLFAAGSGITPIYQLIRMSKKHIREEFTAWNKIELILMYSTKAEYDIILHEEVVKEAADDNTWVRFICDSSSAESAKTRFIREFNDAQQKQGKTLNTAPFERLTQENLVPKLTPFRFGITPDNYAAIICGPKEYTNMVSNSFIEAGLPDDRVLIL